MEVKILLLHVKEENGEDWISVEPDDDEWLEELERDED